MRYLVKVRCLYEDLRLVQCLYRNRMHYFYLSRSQIKKFSPYLQDDVFIDIETNDKLIVVGNVEAYSVVSFNRVYKVIGNKEITYFDINEIKDSVKKLLEVDKYKMFIDLEFSMPPYDYKHGSENQFHAEIIQYGIIITEPDGTLIDTYKGYVKPICIDKLSDRTKDFLHVSEGAIMNAPSYLKFYDLLRNIMSTYQPVIYMWGRNDYLEIADSYNLHKVKPITERKHFVNLMQVIKNYFNIRNDIGLYNAYQLFNANPPLGNQDHDALNDALATYEIFKLFNELMNN